MVKKILIIGAGFLQDFVICKAKELGYYTIAIDGNPDAIGLKHADKSAVIDIVDEEACLQFAKQEKINGVLTAATDFGVLSTSYIAEQLGLPGVDYETARIIKNKYEVRRRLIEAQVDDTHDVYEIRNNTDLASLKIQYPIMVKPSDGSGSRATTRVDNVDELSRASNLALKASLAKRAIAESFIDGREYGAEAFVYNGKVQVLGVMKKWMTKPPYYAELGHQIPSELPEKIEEKAKKCIENAILALGINHGAVNMDIIINTDGDVHIIDVGARMGGNLIGSHIIPYGTGIDYMDAIIKSAVGDPVIIKKGTHSNVTTRLLAFDKGIIKSIPDMKKIEKKYGVEIYHHMIRGMEVNEYHTNLDGCGYIVAKADKVEEAVEKADNVLNLIKNTCLEM